MTTDQSLVWQITTFESINPDPASRHREASEVARHLIRRLLIDHSLASADTLIDVLSRDSRDRHTRPQVLIDACTMPWSLSIAHTESAVFVALSTDDDLSVGVDLVEIRPLGTGFAKTWFYDQEMGLLDTNEPLALCRLWAVKEAVYKAVNRDEPFAPRQIRIQQIGDHEFTCTYHGRSLADRCRIETWCHDSYVAAIATFRKEKHPCTHAGRETYKSYQL